MGREYNEPWINSMATDGVALHGDAHVMGNICCSPDAKYPESQKHWPARRARIIAAVNACAGIPQEQLAAMAVGELSRLNPPRTDPTVCVWCGIHISATVGDLKTHAMRCEKSPHQQLMKLNRLQEVIINRMDDLLRRGLSLAGEGDYAAWREAVTKERLEMAVLDPGSAD